MNLYKVETKRLTCYVIADDPTEAKLMFESWLDKEDYDFTKYRQVTQVTQIAAENVYPSDEVFNMLLIKPKEKELKDGIAKD